jgi:hypothetical protein
MMLDVHMINISHGHYFNRKYLRSPCVPVLVLVLVLLVLPSVCVDFLITANLSLSSDERKESGKVSVAEYSISLSICYVICGGKGREVKGK